MDDHHYRTVNQQGVILAALPAQTLTKWDTDELTQVEEPADQPRQSAFAFPGSPLPSPHTAAAEKNQQTTEPQETNWLIEEQQASENGLTIPEEPGAEAEISPAPVPAQPYNATQPNKTPDPPVPPTSASIKEAGIPKQEPGEQASVPSTAARMPMRPTSPARPNDWDHLEKQFGLKYTAPSEQKPGAQAEDSTRRDSTAHTEGSATRPTTVAFTLMYTHRYDGYLPLHDRARQMLDGRTRLKCVTDYEAWEFTLYVDYAQKRIVGHQELAGFFAAYNIPPGGIVHLTLVHGDTVQLYWKAQPSQVTKIRCLELLSDGTLEEYEVPSAEFPCEIAEYVLRAEKRFEDMDALFEQARDKNGIFQTICEVFGEGGRELEYDAVFDGVQQIRQVAKASIDWQLRQRPCFVEIALGRWRFEPTKGVVRLQSQPKVREITSHSGQKEHSPRFPSTESTMQPASTGNPDGLMSDETPLWINTGNQGQLVPDATPLLENRHTPFLADLHTLWPSWALLGAAEEDGVLTHLEQLVAQLVELTNRIQAYLESERSKHEESRELTRYWAAVCRVPADPAAHQDLELYLEQQINNHLEKCMEALDWQLRRTATQDQHTLFFPVLHRIADRLATEGQAAKARRIYNLLKEHGAGELSATLSQLDADQQLQEYLELIEIATTPDECWPLWHAAWQEHTGAPALREGISREVAAAVPRVHTEIRQDLLNKNISAALAKYHTWDAIVRPLADAWQTMPVAAQVWSVVGTLFDGLIQTEKPPLSTTEQALRLLATVPADHPCPATSAIYLDAILSVAQAWASIAPQAAVGLLDYSLYIVQQQPAQTPPNIWRNLEQASALYEQLGLLERAEAHIKQAQSHAPRDQRSALGVRWNQIKKKRDDIPMVNPSAWVELLDQLRADTSFRSLINLDSFDRFLTVAAKPAW